MAVQMVLFIVLSSGSVFGAAFFRRRYEEILPITCGASVLLMFLLGVCGSLAAGFYAVLAAGAALYILAALRVVRRRSGRELARRVFTPAFFFFALCFLGLTVLNHGRLVSAWDEFSHWGDVVKAMVQLDDFGTNPASNSFFKSYPPGMSLFQYFALRLALLLAPGSGFCEWRLYFSYQIFMLAFFLPFLRNMSFRRPMRCAVSMLGALVLPLLFFSGSYSSIYIDPALGVLAGAGLAAVFTHGERDGLYTLYVFITAAVLVLMKDAGMFFAVFLMAAYFIDETAELNNEHALRRCLQRPFLLELGLGVLTVALPKLLWSLNMTLNHVDRWFTGKVDFRQLLMILLRRDDSYRSTLLLQFGANFFDSGVSLGDSGFGISFAGLSVLSIALTYGAYLLLKGDEGRRRSRRWLVALTGVMLAAYVFGLLLVYMFKFSQYDGAGMTSYVRYMSIPFAAVWAMLVLIFVDVLLRSGGSGLCAAVLAALALLTPWNPVGELVTRYSVGNSIEARQPYINAAERVLSVVGEEPVSIYVVSQDEAGSEWLPMMFQLRPSFVRGGRLGEPLYDGDSSVLSVTADQWRDMLAADYDYVFLCKLDDGFSDSYSAAFARPQDICQGGIYKVNTDTRLLELCESQ